MNNRERTPKQDNLHLFIAIRRNKENKDGQELCCREIIYDEKTSLDILMARIRQHSGTWRIYKTVNARNIEKARLLLLMKLIENPENAYKVNTIWKTCLLQPKCRVENNLTWDIDGTITMTMIELIYKERNIVIKEIIKTPNGYNVITDICDTRLFNKEELKKEYKLDDFGYSRDGLKHITRVVI